jgi:hypothetical protein
VTITGPGVVTILASQPGNGNYSEATPVTRTFRVLNPVFRLSAIAVESAGVTLQWNAQAGARYRVRSSDSLSSGLWNLAGEVTGSGGTATLLDPSPAPATRFYIIELVL